MNLGNGLFTNKIGDVSNNSSKFSYVISCDNARLSLYIFERHLGFAMHGKSPTCQLLAISIKMRVIS